MGGKADYAAIGGPPAQHRWVVVIVTTFSDEPLTVYGDESHDEQRQRVFAVAGLLGDKSDWDTATGRWLDRTGGMPFHAVECESEYANHADKSLHQKNLRLYADLTKILARLNLMGFGSALDLAGWKQSMPAGEPAEEHAYYKCFSEVVIYFGRVGNLSIPRRRVKFIFDRSGPREYTARQLYSFMAQSPDWPSSECLTDEIGSATRATPGIQMADLLARETMKQLDNEIGPVRRPVRQSMTALLASRRFRFEYYTREYCEKLVASARRWVESAGFTPERYQDWLSARRLHDTLPSRIRFTAEL